jgi:hypothetical protein
MCRAETHAVAVGSLLHAPEIGVRTCHVGCCTFPPTTRQLDPGVTTQPAPVHAEPCSLYRQARSAAGSKFAFSEGSIKLLRRATLLTCAHGRIKFTGCYCCGRGTGQLRGLRVRVQDDRYKDYGNPAACLPLQSPDVWNKLFSRRRVQGHSRLPRIEGRVWRHNASFAARRIEIPLPGRRQG